ncbi:uncharacterized protein [Temnothorax longispinosus]|uniref:uncharacterized protein n=1 Tax=Temnothorax longispinosus TaxID=300112 RepID=UPI003A98DD7A
MRIPLLFSLFINDIGAFLRFTERIIFADDTQIYRKCFLSELNVGLRLVAHDVGVIAEFAAANGLSLNLHKSKVLILGGRRYVKQIDLNNLPLIAVNGTTIPFVTEARNLGVIMTSDLSWKSHVNHVSKRVHFTLHKLKFHKNSLSYQLRVKLVTTLIWPLIDYCSLVYNDLTDELNLKLQRLINCAIRFIFNLRRDERITPYRHRLKWLSVKNRRRYFLGTEMYKISKGMSPSYLSEIFIRSDPLIRRSSRLELPQTFVIPNHRTESYRRSFHLAGIYLWNSLPAEIVSSSSVTEFKNKLYNYLFSLELNSDQGSTAEPPSVRV